MSSGMKKDLGGIKVFLGVGVGVLVLFLGTLCCGVYAQNGVHLRLVNAQLNVTKVPLWMTIGGQVQESTNVTSPGVSPYGGENLPADTTEYAAVNLREHDKRQSVVSKIKADLYSGMWSLVVYDGGYWPTLPEGCCDVKSFILSESAPYPGQGLVSLRLVNLWRSADPISQQLSFLINGKEVTPTWAVFGNTTETVNVPFPSSPVLKGGAEGKAENYPAPPKGVLQMSVIDTKSNVLYSAMFEVIEGVAYEFFAVPGGITNNFQFPVLDVFIEYRDGGMYYDDASTA